MKEPLAIWTSEDGQLGIVLPHVSQYVFGDPDDEDDDPEALYVLSIGDTFDSSIELFGEDQKTFLLQLALYWESKS